MARRLIWSSRAHRDLFAIIEHIAADAPINAASVARRIVERTEALPDQPGQGRYVPEAEDRRDLREVIVQRWRVIYRTSQDELIIVTIVHGARLLKNLPPL